MSIELIALRPLCGDYGLKHPGQLLSVDSEEDAESLEARGLAERIRPPSRAGGLFQKMIADAPENKSVLEKRKRK